MRYIVILLFIFTQSVLAGGGINPNSNSAEIPANFTEEGIKKIKKNHAEIGQLFEDVKEKIKSLKQTYAYIDNLLKNPQEAINCSVLDQIESDLNDIKQKQTDAKHKHATEEELGQLIEVEQIYKRSFESYKEKVKNNSNCKNYY